ncbi:MAG: DNA internalization-related competence protein ComEC/Rec2 [Nitrospiraceae bacterium]|nr:DNA internalization-related competence protein ComEC/Rec2 [Nitrospiraceae bacterium]
MFGIIYAFFRYSPEIDMQGISGKEFIASGVFISEPVRNLSPYSVDSEEFIQKFETNSISINLISEDEFEVGKNYKLLIKTNRDNTRLNPGMIKNENLYARLINIIEYPDTTKSISIWSSLQKSRGKLNKYIYENFKPDSGALIASITTGQRTGMSEELKQAFNSTGLTHILSVSGTHFGLFSVFLFGIFRFLINLLPHRFLQRITVYLAPSQLSALLCLPFMIAYLGISGTSTPALRSFIMISLFLAGLLIGRKGFWLNSLLFAAVVIMLWQPDSVLTLSFQLSFIAVLFIGFFIEHEYENIKTKSSIKEIIKNTVFITLAASLGTASLVAYHFHYFSIISPATNLFITPFIGFVLLPISLISGFSFLITEHYIFTDLNRMLADFTVYLVLKSGSIPFTNIAIPAFPVFLVILFYAGAVFYFVKKNKYALIIPSVILIVFVLISTLNKSSGVSVTYLDVGQGDSSVITLPDNKIIVMDSGRTGKETASFLKYKGRKTIDVLVLTHPHPDHIGGINYLAGNFSIKEIWDNGRFSYTEEILEDITHKTLQRGDVYKSKGYFIFVLHPYKEFYTLNGDEYNEENNSSLVIRIAGKNKSFIFTGDVEEEAEEDIAHLDKWIKSSVIKIPHHGSRTSASDVFLNAVSPEIAVISAGRDNSFGHPHQEMVEKLSAVKILRTDRNGAVKITARDDQLEVKTYKDFQFEKTKTFSGEIKNIRALFTLW